MKLGEVFTFSLTDYGLVFTYPPKHIAPKCMRQKPFSFVLSGFFFDSIKNGLSKSQPHKKNGKYQN